MKIFIFVFITLFAFNLADDVTEVATEVAATETIVVSTETIAEESSTDNTEASPTENSEAPSTENTAESTTENNSNDKPDTSYVNKWLEAITEKLEAIVKDANEQMDSMQEKMKQALENTTKVPDYLRKTIITAINTFTETFTSGLTTFTAQISGFIQSAFASISKALSGSVATVTKMQQCLKENGESTNVTDNVLSELQKCGTKQIDKVTAILAKIQQAIQKIVTTAMAMPSELIVCLQKFPTGLFGVVQGTTCLSAWVVKMGANGASIAALFVTSAVEIGVLFATAAGEVTGCITGHVNEMVQAGSKVSASVATCMAN